MNDREEAKYLWKAFDLRRPEDVRMLGAKIHAMSTRADRWQITAEERSSLMAKLRELIDDDDKRVRMGAMGLLAKFDSLNLQFMKVEMEREALDRIKDLEDRAEILAAGGQIIDAGLESDEKIVLQLEARANGAFSYRPANGQADDAGGAAGGEGGDTSA